MKYIKAFWRALLFREDRALIISAYLIAAFLVPFCIIEYKVALAIINQLKK